MSHFLFYPFRIIPSYRCSRAPALYTRFGLLGIPLFSITDRHPPRIPVHFLNPAFHLLSLTLVFRCLDICYIYMYVDTLVLQLRAGLFLLQVQSYAYLILHPLFELFGLGLGVAALVQSDTYYYSPSLAKFLSFLPLSSVDCIEEYSSLSKLVCFWHTLLCTSRYFNAFSILRHLSTAASSTSVPL